MKFLPRFDFFLPKLDYSQFIMKKKEKEKGFRFRPELIYLCPLIEALRAFFFYLRYSTVS